MRRVVTTCWVAGLLGLCAGMVPARAEAQAAPPLEWSVRVRVVSEMDAVGGANIRVGSVRRISDGMGEAVFKVVAGRTAVAVEAVGYTSYSDSVSIRGDTTIVVALESEVVEIEEIIVTSTRGDRRIEDEPVKVEVVTREEVEEKILMTPGSIAMLLNETPGLRVQETSPALGGAVIRIQGLQGRYTQLLSDGLPLYGGQAGSLGILQIPPIDLAQVEVIKGAASALYGASALGGAINLVSRRPADDTELMLNRTSRGGTDAVLWQSRAVSERVGYTALVSGHLQDRQFIDGDAWADLPMYRRLVARPRVFIQTNAVTAMVTSGVMVEDREGGGVVPDGSSFPQELGTARFDVGATARRMIGGSLQVDVRGSMAVTSHTHTFGATREDDRHATTFIEASLRGNTGAHYWVAGAALQRDAYAAEQLPAFDYGYWIPSVFVQDEVTFSSRIVGSFSLRADHHSEYGAFIAPRVTTLFRVRDDASLRLTAGRGFFGPTPFTEETEEVGLSRVRPPQGLEAEVADLLSADLSWAVSGVETNVSVFASRIAHALRVVERPGALELVNLPSHTRTGGVDALARYRREPFGITASYTFIDARQPTVDGSGTEDAPLVPRHAASMVAVYEEHGEGRVGLEIYHTGRQVLEDTSYSATSRPYTLFGLLVERRFGTVRAFLNMENLTNVRQTKYQPLLRRAVTDYGRWTTDVWAPVDGRTFNGGVRITL